ncbi:hypothetical protein A3712_20840 [Vibrio sp. HI00D65]|nr:hypothetical protein A3712_20840 [Vibrio sp. HI00D65]
MFFMELMTKAMKIVCVVLTQKLNKSTETRMKQSVLLTTLDLNMVEKVKGLKECESAFSLNGNRAKDVFAENSLPRTVSTRLWTNLVSLNDLVASRSGMKKYLETIVSC